MSKFCFINGAQDCFYSGWSLSMAEPLLSQRYIIEEKHEIEDITSNNLIQELMHNLPGYKNGFIRVKPSGFVFISETQIHLERIRKFEVRDDDIWICTFPKCGTTWTQELIWCLMNNFDFKTANSVNLDDRMVFFEYCTILDEVFDFSTDTIQQAADMASPRIIKTHLPFQMLPDQIRTREKTPKIVHVYRNSRDVCVSHYHHWKILKGFSGGFDLWAKLFLEGLGGYYGPFWKHVESYYCSQYDKIFFVKYEDMKKDLRSTIVAASNFIGCNKFSENEILQLEHHLSFTNFQNTPSLNKQHLVNICDKVGCSNQNEGAVFVRKGIVGDWKNYFRHDMSENFRQRDKELSDVTGIVMEDV